MNKGLLTLLSWVCSLMMIHLVTRVTSQGAFTITSSMTDPGLPIGFPYIEIEFTITGDPLLIGAISLTLPPLPFDDNTRKQVFNQLSFEQIQCYRNHDKRIPSSIRYVTHTEAFEITIMDVILSGPVRCQGIKVPEYEVLTQLWDETTSSWYGTGLECPVKLFYMGDTVALTTLPLAVTPFSEPDSVHAVISTHTCDQRARASFFMKKAPIVIRKTDRMYLFSNETNYYFDGRIDKAVSCSFYVPSLANLEDYLNSDLDSTHTDLDPSPDVIDDTTSITPYANTSSLRFAEMSGALIKIPVRIDHHEDIQAVQIFRDEDVPLHFGARLSCEHLFTTYHGSINLGKLVQSKIEVFHPDLFLRKYSVQFDSMTCQPRIALFKYKPIISVQAVSTQSSLRITARLQGSLFMDLRKNDIIFFMGAGMPENNLSVSVTYISVASRWLQETSYTVTPAFDGVGSSFLITFIDPVATKDTQFEIGLIFLMPVTVNLPSKNMWGIVSLRTATNINMSYRVTFENIVSEFKPLLTLSGSIFSMSVNPLPLKTCIKFSQILTRSIIGDELHNPDAVCRIVNVSPGEDISHQIVIQCYNLDDTWVAIRRFYAEEDLRTSLLFDLDLDDSKTPTNTGVIPFVTGSSEALSEPDVVSAGGYGAKIDLKITSASKICFAQDRFGHFINCANSLCMGVVGCDVGMTCSEDFQCVTSLCHKPAHSDVGTCIEYGQDPPSRFSWYIAVVCGVVILTLVIVVYVLISGYLRRKKQREESKRLLSSTIGHGNLNQLQSQNGSARTSIFSSKQYHPFHASLYDK